MEEIGEHEANEGDPVEARERSGEAFVVAIEPAKACGPAEGAFDDPGEREQDEAAFGVVEF